jgi:hypothetical protein
MAKAEHIVDWVFDAIDKLGQGADFAKVTEEIWHLHESELRESGELYSSGKPFIVASATLRSSSSVDRFTSRRKRRWPTMPPSMTCH